MADTFTGFNLNYQNEYYINTTPSQSTETWSRLAAGISNVSWSGNEVIDQSNYYDGKGLASSDVTGGQLIAAVSGHRKYGDAAQDYVMSLKTDYGESRKTELLWGGPDGKWLLCDITICNIDEQAGEANAKDNITFELHVNGEPKGGSKPTGA